MYQSVFDTLWVHQNGIISELKQGVKFCQISKVYQSSAREMRPVDI